MKFSEKFHISPSATITINSLASQKAAAGEKVYNFAAGDPHLKVHPVVAQAAIQGIENGYAPYAPVAGLLSLRTAIAEWVNQQHGGRFEMKQTLVTCGGKFALSVALEALLNDGDEVLFAAPYWVSYPDMALIFGGVPKSIPTTEQNGWKMTAEDLRKHVTSRSRVLILNNACNPTGVLYTKEELGEILAEAKRADLVVLSDEVYSNIVYDHHTFVSCAHFHEHAERIMIVQSCSKNFGMAGWRVGFALGPEELIKRMIALQGHSTTGTSIVSQWAALAAIKHADVVNPYVKQALEKRRNVFVETYRKLFGVHLPLPESAIYVFSPLMHFTQKEKDDVAFCEGVLQRANVAIVPGIAFGQKGFVRFSFSEEEEQIVGGLEALRKVCT